ncbi:MAG: hypothetical protein LBJ92_02930 [Holosporales bacterium]|jgi:hypothetical protein|nr:hypothetical protein [Holosporales bacterium]
MKKVLLKTVVFAIAIGGINPARGAETIENEVFAYRQVWTGALCEEFDNRDGRAAVTESGDFTQQQIVAATNDSPILLGIHTTSSRMRVVALNTEQLRAERFLCVRPVLMPEGEQLPAFYDPGEINQLIKWNLWDRKVWPSTNFMNLISHFPCSVGNAERNRELVYRFSFAISSLPAEISAENLGGNYYEKPDDYRNPGRYEDATLAIPLCIPLGQRQVAMHLDHNMWVVKTTEAPDQRFSIDDVKYTLGTLLQRPQVGTDARICILPDPSGEPKIYSAERLVDQ